MDDDGQDNFGFVRVTHFLLFEVRLDMPEWPEINRADQAIVLKISRALNYYNQM